MGHDLENALPWLSSTPYGTIAQNAMTARERPILSGRLSTPALETGGYNGPLILRES
jgi:hypothetical protein